MRCPWLFIACTLAGIFLGLRIGALVVEHFGVDPPRVQFATPEIISMEIRQVEQARLGIVLSIALGGTAGLIAYDAVIRWRRKKATPPTQPPLQFSLRDIFLAVMLVALGLAILVLEPPRASSGCIVQLNSQIYVAGVSWGLAAGIFNKRKVQWAILGFMAAFFVDGIFYG